MTIGSRLKELLGAITAARRGSDTSPRVRWVAAADNPFGVKLLDCRNWARTMIATTSDAKVAESFAALRSSDGQQYRGQSPEDGVTRE